MDLLDRPCRANYEVGRRVQNVIGSAIVHHECVLVDGADVRGDAYQGWTLVAKNGTQDVEILGGRGVAWFFDDLAVRCVQYSIGFLG